MRIAIDIEEKQPAPTVKTALEHATVTSPAELPAISAGGAPENLLRTLGVSPAKESTRPGSPGSSEAAADAMLAGTAPEWLVRAIESAGPPRLGKY
jgi:hypothetical protein